MVARMEPTTHSLAPGDLSLQRNVNLVILCAAVLVVVMAFALETRPDGRVFFRFAPGHVLPHTCASKIVFDANCAGCGLTRSFIHLAAFRLADSWHAHRAGWVMAMLVVGQIPYRLLRLKRIRAGKLPHTPVWIWAAPGVVMAAILLHWGLQLVGI